MGHSLRLHWRYLLLHVALISLGAPFLSHSQSLCSPRPSSPFTPECSLTVTLSSFSIPFVRCFQPFFFTRSLLHPSHDPDRTAFSKHSVSPLVYPHHTAMTHSVLIPCTLFYHSLLHGTVLATHRARSHGRSTACCRRLTATCASTCPRATSWTSARPSRSWKTSSTACHSSASHAEPHPHHSLRRPCPARRRHLLAGRTTHAGSRP